MGQRRGRCGGGNNSSVGWNKKRERKKKKRAGAVDIRSAVGAGEGQGRRGGSRLARGLARIDVRERTERNFAFNQPSNETARLRWLASRRSAALDKAWKAR